MTVRPMRAADTEAAGRLLAASFTDVLARYLPYAQPGTSRFLRDELARLADSRAKEFLVFADKGQVVGFAEYRLEGPASAFLSYVCVADWARRRGVATAIMERFLDDHPILARLELDVFEDNQAARRFYERIGFAAVAESAWYRRPLPTPSDPIDVPDLAAKLLTHGRYGFSVYEFEWLGENRRVGRIGETTLRCFDDRSFADDALLGRLHATFPRAEEALLVGVVDQRQLPGDSSQIISAQRMAWVSPVVPGGPR